jgi:hypothetical protein
VSIGSVSSTGIITMARGRNGDLYGVNGLERGFRWDGATEAVEQLGISAPGTPTVTSTEGTPAYYLHHIDVTDGGSGYVKEPAVTLSGNAKAKAEIVDGRVSAIVIQDYGSGYTAEPTITVGAPDGAGGGGTGATFSVTVTGRVSVGRIISGGSGYTSEPAVSVSGGGGSGAVLRAIVADGSVRSVIVVNPGSGYTSQPSVSISGDAAATVEMLFKVSSVSVTTGGSGYTAAPLLRFLSLDGGGAQATCAISAGAVAWVQVIESGYYVTPPTCGLVPGEPNRTATVRPSLRPSLRGKYWCAIRYVDNTTTENAGPIPSNISELAEIELSSPVQSLNWSWSVSGQEARVDKIELWRTTADQALVLYRVATVAPVETSYTDSLGDSLLASPSRAGFKALPIVLPNGQPNARRFRIPPQNKSSIVMFQDRAWFGVDVAGRKYDGSSAAAHSEPNTLYFSEVDEPESVPEPNELILQDNVNGGDRITSLMPFGGGMVVFQERHAYRLSYAAQPIIDANFVLLAQRGCLNQRCWVTHNGVAYVADSSGIYVLDGSTATPISDGIDTYWTRSIIDFAAAKNFFMSVDPVTRIVRFHFAVANNLPDRALCFHAVTQAWWEEQYAQQSGAAAIARTGGKQRLLVGAQSGILLHDAGGLDIDAEGSGVGIACSMRTGTFPLMPKGDDRSLRVLYSPTTAACNLLANLHYNNSSSPRPAAIATDRGSGFTTSGGGAATLNLAAARSSLGDATGYATAMYAGRLDDRSAGGDRHIALGLALTRPSTESVTLHGLAIQGAGQ